MLDIIRFGDNVYPHLQSTGHASRWCLPFAQEVFKSCDHKKILDIGCCKKEWSYPGSIPIDLDFDDPYDAMNLPHGKFDGIFSSHCLEHLPNYVDAIDYWYSKLEGGGVLFLYLPHPAQEYWKPFNNRKHVHSLNPDIIRQVLVRAGFHNVFVTDGYDFNHSFYAVADKSF